MQFLPEGTEIWNHITIGILTLLANIGAKWVYNDLDDKLEGFLANKWMRKIYVFSIVYVATKSLPLSLILTGIYWVLMYFLSSKDT